METKTSSASLKEDDRKTAIDLYYLESFKLLSSLKTDS